MGDFACFWAIIPFKHRQIPSHFPLFEGVSQTLASSISFPEALKSTHTPPNQNLLSNLDRFNGYKIDIDFWPDQNYILQYREIYHQNCRIFDENLAFSHY
jgi:hypothetical protein